MKKVRLRYFAIFFSILLSVIFSTGIVHNAQAEVQFPNGRYEEWSENNIVFYNPDEKDNDSPPWDGCNYELTGDTLQEKVLSFLLGKGLNPIAASGVYGNMMSEGLGSGVLLAHENGVDDTSDIGKCYKAATHYSTCTGAPKSGLLVREHDVRDLEDEDVMHGLGFIQWSFKRRINLMNALGSYRHYATDWDGSRYTYDNYTYTDFALKEGQDVADGILSAELDFFYTEHLGYKVTSDDIAAQGISKYGITAGMGIFDALNKLNTPCEAATLFFTTSEMPGRTTLEASSPRCTNAQNGFDIISGGVTAGDTDCTGGGGDIASTAIDLAWKPGESGWDGKEGTSAYKQASQATGLSGYSDETDCARFVAVVLRYSGYDPNAPTGSKTLTEYMASHSDLYQKITPSSASDLQPGDIISKDGHSKIYVVYNGTGMEAQASLGDHAPRLSSGVNFSGYSVFRPVKVKQDNTVKGEE